MQLSVLQEFVQYCRALYSFGHAALALMAQVEHVKSFIGGNAAFFLVDLNECLEFTAVLSPQKAILNHGSLFFFPLVKNYTFSYLCRALANLPEEIQE